MKRLRTTRRGQTRVSQRRLGCLSPGPCEAHSAWRQTSSSSRRWLEFLMYKNLSELPKNPTSKQTNGPGTISASAFAQEACFDLHKQTRFEISFCDMTKILTSESDSKNNNNQPKKCKLFVCFQVQGDCVFIIHFFVQADNPKGTF